MIDDFYKELFLKGQENGNYQMFTFDIKNSKQMDKSTRYEAQVKIIELIESIFECICYKIENLPIIKFGDEEENKETIRIIREKQMKKTFVK